MKIRNKLSLIPWRVAALLICALLASPANFAHPMGNFSINHYAGIRVEQGAVEIQYLIEMAEIPTFQEMQKYNFSAQVGDPQAQTYLSRQAAAFLNGLLLTLNGKPLPLRIVSQSTLFTPGAGGLASMKLGILYRASAECAVAPCELEYTDSNFPGRVGWKEV